MLVVNEIEAEMLAGCGPVTAVEPAIRAARMLLSRVPQVVVTLGGRGMVLVTRDAEPLSIAGYAVPVASTHGAGDALIGALAAKLAQGAPLADATTYANAAAAVLVATPEERRECLTEAETTALLSKHPG